MEGYYLEKKGPNVSAWTINLTVTHFCLWLTRKLSSIIVLSNACEGAKQLLQDFKKTLPKGGTDGVCRNQLQSEGYGWGASIREHRASRLLSVAPGRPSCHLKSLCQKRAATKFHTARLRREYLSVTLNFVSCKLRVKHVVTEQKALFFGGWISSKNFFFSMCLFLVLPLGPIVPYLIYYTASSLHKNKSRSTAKLLVKSRSSLKLSHGWWNPFHQVTAQAISYSPEFFLFKVPAVTKYTKNYLAASPSSSITV